MNGEWSQLQGLSNATPKKATRFYESIPPLYCVHYSPDLMETDLSHIVESKQASMLLSTMTAHSTQSNNHL